MPATIVHTTTLLVVVACLVCLKTLALVAVLVRRDRRQRRELDAAVAVGRRARTDPPVWKLQWADPGVLLVEYAGQGSGARDVALSATLTASSGAEASVGGAGSALRRVGCLLRGEVREAGGLVGRGRRGEPCRTAPRPRGSAPPAGVHAQLLAALVHAARGEQRDQTRTALPVLPVADLAIDTAGGPSRPPRDSRPSDGA